MSTMYQQSYPKYWTMNKRPGEQIYIGFDGNAEVLRILKISDSIFCD